MELKSKSAIVIRLTGQIMLFEFAFLLVALMLSWRQLSWVGFFSNLFVTSLLSLALHLGLLIFNQGTHRQNKFLWHMFTPMNLDGSQVVRLAFWLATVIAFFAGMSLALMFMN